MLSKAPANAQAPFIFSSGHGTSGWGIPAVSEGNNMRLNVNQGELKKNPKYVLFHTVCVHLCAHLLDIAH